MFCVAVYDVSGAASDRNCVVLSDIHIDIMDYIQPASCTDAEFRQMWAEFEWENKVSFIFYKLFGVLLMRYNSCSYVSSLRQHSLLWYKPHSTSTLDIGLEYNSFSYCFLFHELSDAMTSFFLQKRCVHWALPPVRKVSRLLGACCVFWLKGEIATSVKFVLRLQNCSYCSASPVWNYVVLFFFFFNHRMFCVVGDLLVTV